MFYNNVPAKGGSNEYPQCMFCIKITTLGIPPANPSFSIQKWDLRGYIFYGHVFLMSYLRQVENIRRADFEML